MKKIFSILILIFSCFIFTACQVIDNIFGYEYSSFTIEEKELFNEYFGFEIPFLKTDYYEVIDLFDTCYQVNYYTSGNTELNFKSYLNTIDSLYTFVKSEADTNGIDIYYYEALNNTDSKSRGEKVNIILTYYYMGDYSYMDLYLSYPYDTNNEILKNDGYNEIPESNKINIQNADYNYKTSLESALLTLPSIGEYNVLVVPVEFANRKASEFGCSRSVLDKAYNGKNSLYPSVSEYFKISSYNKLNIEFDVLDEWVTLSKSSNNIYYKDEYNYASETLFSEVLSLIDGKIDFSKYDNNKDGYIDGIVMVNTLRIDSEIPLNWAYQGTSTSTNEYDGVRLGCYVWEAYDFLKENNQSFSGEAINTKTFIHEFSHLFGLDDYYSSVSTLSDIDMMDDAFSDHNPFSKMLLGWIDEVNIVNIGDECEITLKDYSLYNDCLILSSSYKKALGLFQEYYIIIYYTKNKLNNPLLDCSGLIIEEGLVIYHVNGSLCDGNKNSVYDIYSSNIPEYEFGGTATSLIEYIGCASIGEEFRVNLKDDSNNSYLISLSSSRLLDNSLSVKINK